MVLCIPTQSHFNPPPVSHPIFHSFHTSSSSSSSSSSAPTFLLALPQHPSLTFIPPSAPPPLLLLLPGAAITHTHTHTLWICAADLSSLLEPWLSLSFLLVNWSNLQRNPEMCPCESAPCSESVLFSVMSEENFPSLVTAVVFSSLSRFF